MKNKKIAIIGAGIVGSTAAYKLAKAGHSVTIFDEGTGQATAGAAGIICPWLSQRRNKQWYHLTSTGASYYPILMKELQQEGITEIPYKQVGTYVFKHKEEQLEKLLTIAEKRKIYKGVNANVDFYSGLVYSMLGLPQELYTPIFAAARIVGWSAHRLEELKNVDKIIRPAYKPLSPYKDYITLENR